MHRESLNMKAWSFSSLLLLGLCGALAGCNGFERNDTFSFNGVEPDSTWRRIDARDAFSFRLPSRLQAKEVQGIDSYIGAYEDSTLRVSFDYGWYSGFTSERGQSSYTKEEIEINGHRAILVSYRLEGAAALEREGFTYFTSVFFPAPVEDEDEDGDGIIADTTDELSMEAVCKTVRDCAVAHGIFKSVRFPE